MSTQSEARRPKNAAEAQFYDLALSKGWRIVNRGWPIFLIEKEDQVALVKVEQSSRARLRPAHAHILSAICGFNVPCFVWTPDAGFKPIAPYVTVGNRRGVVEPSNSSKEKTNPLTPRAPFSSPPLPTAVATEPVTRSKDVGEVWDCYVRVMEPRRKEIGDEERDLIRKALKVAIVEECCHAIEGCSASAYHMGDNPRGKKYNKLTHILKGKRGKRTTREQIDMFLDIREKAVEHGTVAVSSVDPALVAQRKDDVRRGFRLKGDPSAQRRAKAAEQWLKQHGIRTKRRADGYPLWTDGGNG